MPTLTEFDALPAADARALLLECCGSTRWAAAMISARPIGDLQALYATGDRIWWDLRPEDWREAFAAHPRIGARAPIAPVASQERSATWAAQEQAAAAASSDEAVVAALAQVNREYETRFGHIYLVCATGRSAEELLANAHSRLKNDATTELRVAAEEQRRITRLRLARLFGGNG